MAIELISRPIGHKISLLPVTAVIVNNGAGDAVVYVEGGHSLSDGDYVYIESNFDSYNGYKYVDATSYDYFKIKNSENSDPVEYVQDADISLYVSLLDHGWQGVHTPIAYELHSDIYPVNEAEEEYNPNVVDSFNAYGGNTQINLDHALSDPTALSWIEIVGTGELAGRYQILTVLQPWSVVINLAYDAGNDFTGYTIVRSYNNYHINVGVYAGLESGHRWQSEKPFELASTLKLIPDSFGNVKFSIHEILRGYIEIRNNLTLDTLPNNLDFHVSFYIAYSESYDESDGSEVTTFTGEETVDTFVGHAVNAMMPFKSLSESFMSDYVSGGGELARWLTLFENPLAVVGYFFDISFINTYDGVDIIILRNGELFQTITNPGSGIIRVMFIPESGYTEYCLQAFTVSAEQSVSLAGFTNVAGANEDWVEGVNPQVVLNFPVTPNNSDILQDDYAFVVGIEYTVTVFTTVGGSGTMTIRIMDDSFNTLESSSALLVGGGDRSITFTATSETTKIGFSAGGNSLDLTLSNLRITEEQVQITEQICIDIIEECQSTLNNRLRITDGSELRRV